MADAVESSVRAPAAASAAATAASGVDADNTNKSKDGRPAKKEKRGGRVAKKETKAKADAAADDEDGSTSEQRNRVPKCKECHKEKDDLFRDKKDGKLYCASCWKKWYKRGPPANARFVQGAPRSAKGAPHKEDEPVVPTQPIAPESVDVDQFYEAVLQEGAPSVFVGKDKIAWSVMLKGANDRFGYALLQLITHDDCCVVYSRTGRVNEGADNAKETYHETKGIAEAKDKFCDVFFDFTKNKFDDVKRCVTKFVTRGEYTLTADVKAARRAENEANRLAREAKEQKMVQERNAHIVATAKAELGVEGATEPTTKKATKKISSDANLSQPGIRPEDRRKSPKPAPIETDSSSPNNQDDGELSPAEPPCTPAVAPQAAPAAVSPRPKPTAAPKKPVKMAQPPASPRAGPTTPPPKSVPAQPKTAPAAAPAAPAKKKMMTQDDEPQSSSATLMIVGVVAIAAAAAGFVFMRKK